MPTSFDEPSHLHLPLGLSTSPLFSPRVPFGPTSSDTLIQLSLWHSLPKPSLSPFSTTSLPSALPPYLHSAFILTPFLSNPQRLSTDHLQCSPKPSTFVSALIHLHYYTLHFCMMWVHGASWGWTFCSVFACMCAPHITCGNTSSGLRPCSTVDTSKWLSPLLLIFLFAGASQSHNKKIFFIFLQTV